MTPEGAFAHPARTGELRRGRGFQVLKKMVHDHREPGRTRTRQRRKRSAFHRNEAKMVQQTEHAPRHRPRKIRRRSAENQQFPQERVAGKHLEGWRRRNIFRGRKKEGARRGISDCGGMAHAGRNPSRLPWRHNVNRIRRLQQKRPGLGREELVFRMPVERVAVPHRPIGITEGLQQRLLDAEPRDRPAGLNRAEALHGCNEVPFGQITTVIVRSSQDGHSFFCQIPTMESSSHQNEVVRQFTLQATPFAQHQAHSVPESFAVIRAMAGLDGTQRVLDAGCGPGLVSAALASHCREIVGVDVTPAMIEEARDCARTRGLENVRFVTAHIGRLPFDDGEFDATVTRYVFHHLEDPFEAFREMVRVTRPGGRIVVCDASPVASRREAYDAFEKKRDPSHSRALTLEELVSLGERLHLNEVQVKRFGLPAEAESLIASSFPDGERAELLELLRADVERNACGLAARVEDGKCFITFPIAVLGWRK